MFFMNVYSLQIWARFAFWLIAAFICRRVILKIQTGTIIIMKSKLSRIYLRIHVEMKSWALLSILIWLDSFPLLSQRTRTVLYSPDISTGSKPRPRVLHVHVTAVSHVNFLFSFFHKKDISWVIIRIEIKMKSSALLPSNLPRVIDRSNLSPRRFAARW